MILLVEDDDDVRDLIELTLKGKGFAVEAVTNGNAALEAIARERPCLMILDLVMPRMSGRELLAQMKARQLDEIPVCVISALSDATPSEAVASLCKPFEVSELLAVANRYCARASLSAASRG